MPTASRQQNLLDIGVNPYIESRQSSTGGWTPGSISPGELPIPPGFLTPEQIVQQSKANPAPKPITAQDFMTKPIALHDPKLASRPYASTPTTMAKEAPISVSAYGNVNVPAFLTNAVNNLNQTQSLKAALQEDWRQQLLQAVLGGNYLAAEALRATSVQPGAKVAFGQAVQNPVVGAAQLVQSTAQAKQLDLANKATQQRQAGEYAAQSELAQIQQKLAGIPTGAAFGPERAALTNRQFQIEQQIQKMQGAVTTPTSYNAWVPRYNFGF